MAENKYLVKAFDYDGNFYGYATPHPDDPENESFSYYVDDIKEAKQFDSYIEADNYIERFQDGSDLEYVVMLYNPDSKQQELNDKIVKTIRDFVGNNYGANEADHPSWNIEALAGAIVESLNN